MLLIMGFHIFLSVALFHSPSLPLSLVYTLSNTVSNFLRIIRPSSEPGQWKTLLRIAPSTSRFSSPRTSSTSNLQVGRECEIKCSGCDLRCQLDGVFLRLVRMRLLLFNRARMQEIMGWHLLKNSFSGAQFDRGGFLLSVCIVTRRHAQHCKRCVKVDRKAFSLCCCRVALQCHELSCLSFWVFLKHQLSRLIFHLSVSTKFISLKDLRACAAAKLSQLWRSAGQIGSAWLKAFLRVSASFCVACWRESLLLTLNRRCQSIICEWKKRTQTLSHPLLSLTHLSAYSPGGRQTQF